MNQIAPHASPASRARWTDLAQRLRAPNIVGLDGLRAISIGMVLIAHDGYGSFVPGGTGVTIFFWISGFLITNLLLRELQNSGTVDLGRFYIRRVLRLYPELFALIILCFSVGSLYAWKTSPAEVGAALLYYMNY